MEYAIATKTENILLDVEDQLLFAIMDVRQTNDQDALTDFCGSPGFFGLR